MPTPNSRTAALLAGTIAAMRGRLGSALPSVRLARVARATITVRVRV